MWPLPSLFYTTLSRGDYNLERNSYEPEREQWYIYPFKQVNVNSARYHSIQRKMVLLFSYQIAASASLLY